MGKGASLAVAGITGLRTAHIGRRRGYRLSGRGIAIFRVDRVHGLTLLCSDEELSVARSRRAHAPEPGHG